VSSLSSLNPSALLLLDVRVAIIGRLIRAEHGDGLNLHQQFRPTKYGLDAGRGGQRIKPLLLEECGAAGVEDVVVAFDIPEVATGAHYVVPGCALAGQQAGNVFKGAPWLAGKSPM